MIFRDLRGKSFYILENFMKKLCKQYLIKVETKQQQQNKEIFKKNKRN